MKKLFIWILTITLLFSACGEAAVPAQPIDLPLIEQTPFEEEQVLDAEEPIPAEPQEEIEEAPEPAPQPPPFRVTPQVFDRFVLTEGGRVLAHVPGLEGGIIAVPLRDGRAFRIHPSYATDDMSPYNYQTAIQFYGGHINSFFPHMLMAYEYLYGAHDLERRPDTLPMRAFIGYLERTPSRINGMIWFNRWHALSPAGTLYKHSTWVEDFIAFSNLTPIAENVVSAAVGVYTSTTVDVYAATATSDIQWPNMWFYLIYLTDEGALYFYTDTGEEVLNLRLAEDIADFGISGLDVTATFRTSGHLTTPSPNILFLQKPDGTLVYGQYLESNDTRVTAEQILAGLRAVVASPSGQFERSVQWFTLTHNACLVLCADGVISYAYSYPPAFSEIDAPSEGLVSASVFFQGATGTEPPTSRYLLAIYEDGEILLHNIY